MIIGFVGPARAGKTSCAEYMEEEYNFIPMAFANPLKEGAKVLMNWTDAHVYGHLKERVDPQYGVSPRRVLQTLGTDWGREIIRDDLWIVRAESEMDPANDYVFGDVRFRNEAEMIRRRGGILVRINRPQAPKVEGLTSWWRRLLALFGFKDLLLHPSERDLAKIECDYTIDNDYDSLKPLHEDLERIRAATQE